MFSLCGGSRDTNRSMKTEAIVKEDPLQPSAPPHEESPTPTPGKNKPC